MSNEFRIISDEKYHFISSSLRDTIINAGRKKIVFVEGYDDNVIFNILYDEYAPEIQFIDTEILPNTEEYLREKGACDMVKFLVKMFAANLEEDKRFYGVIDRDLNFDEDIENEKNNPAYAGKLFIFSERYTLENYFIEIDVLTEFLFRQSLKHRQKLKIIASDKSQLKAYIENLTTEILCSLTKIGAGNLTIRHFDKCGAFLEGTIDCRDIKNRVKDRVNNISTKDIEQKFDEFLQFINDANSVHKFASAKEYFSTQFNIKLKKDFKVDIQLNNHKTELASILKKFGLPAEFNRFLLFVTNTNL